MILIPTIIYRQYEYRVSDFTFLRIVQCSLAVAGRTTVRILAKLYVSAIGIYYVDGIRITSSSFLYGRLFSENWQIFTGP